MISPDWQTERQRKRRGHGFYPSDEHLAEVPAIYETDGVPFDNKMIYLHYFGSFGDWYIAELDRETGEAFGYTRLASSPEGAEWGYIYLPELEQFSAPGKIGSLTVPGLLIVEREVDFEPAKFGDVMAGRDRPAATPARPRASGQEVTRAAEAAEAEPGTIVVEGRAYTVEKRDGQDTSLPGEPDLPGYVLRGLRGAEYYTMRNVSSPHRMFLVNGKGFTKNAPRTWLTDRNGSLEVIR